MAEQPLEASQLQAAEEPLARSRWWPRALATIVALIAIGAALVLLPRIAGRPSAGGGLGALDSRAPVLGEPAPNFALRDTSGRVVRLSDLRGQVVLVNFWATWCIPCRDEMPVIEQVYAEQRSQGFAVLEVNEQEPPSTVAEFVAKLGETPTVLLDGDGSVMRQYLKKVPIPGLPDSFVIDRQGTVRGISFGPVSRATILKYIESARQVAP